MSSPGPAPLTVPTAAVPLEVLAGEWEQRWQQTSLTREDQRTMLDALATLLTERDQALVLLGELVENDECDPGPDGCRTHGFDGLPPDTLCPAGQAQDLLAEVGVPYDYDTGTDTLVPVTDVVVTTSPVRRPCVAEDMAGVCGRKTRTLVDGDPYCDRHQFLASGTHLAEGTPVSDQDTPQGCVFCQIVAGGAPATFVAQGDDHVIFEPLGKQVPGHVLVVPRRHVADATTDVEVTAAMFAAAASYARTVGPCNMLTSVGAEATQSVFHLHIHVLPRGPRDGLRRSWPWHRIDHTTEAAS